MDHESPAPVRPDAERRPNQDTVEGQLATEGPALMMLAVLQTGLAVSDPRLIEAVGVALARSFSGRPLVGRLALYQQTLLALDSLTSNDPLSMPAHLIQCVAAPDSPKLRATLAAISELHIRERLALYLCDIARWQRQDVAVLLGLSQSDVRRHLAKGRAHVRAACLGDAVLPDET